MLNKTDTKHLTTCSLSCIWCFLKDRDFFRCSATSGPINRTCMIGYTFEVLLFLFLIPFQCLQVSQKKETQSFQREMSFSVPSFLGTIILSMGSFLQVTFFIDKIKQTRNYHVRKQLRHSVKSNYKASTQNHPSPNNNPPSIIFSLLRNTNTTNNIALLELEIKYVF